MATVGHMYTTPAHTSRNTPVDWRQLKVAGRAACKQSREQNGFQVVAEKLEERREFWKKRNRKLHERAPQLVFVSVLFCRIVAFKSRT